MSIVYREGVPGKICSYCHEWKPVEMFYKKLLSVDGYRPDCKKCVLDRQHERYQKNRDRISERNRQYYERNRKSLIDRASKYQKDHAKERRDYMHQYYHENSDELLTAMRDRRQKNLEEARKRGRNYYHNHPEYREYLRAYQRQWRRDNPDKVRVTWHRRRTREMNAGDSFTAEEWEALKRLYNYTCLCCGRQEPEIKLTPDHIIPLGSPGTGCIENIQPLCLSCNSRKGARTIDYRPNWEDEYGTE